MEVIAPVAIVVAVAAVVGIVILRRRLQAIRTEVSDALATAAEALPRPPATTLDAVRALVADRDEALRRNAFVGSAFERSSDGVLVLGPDREVMFGTATARRLFGGGRSNAEAAVRLRALADEVATTGLPAGARIETSVPEHRAYRAMASPLPPESGPGLSIQITEVTDQERVEAIRRDFVANVSHELKTPVGAMAVLAEALGDADDAETRRRLAERVSVESRRLAALVDDVLDLSLVEGRRPKPTTVDLCEVVSEAVRRVAVIAADAGMRVVASTPEAPLMVPGDRRQLVSAVANLLDNAIKYSSFRSDGEAEVSVSAGRVADEAIIEVEDHGMGISDRHRTRIFERFYRVDSGRARSRGGTGLGLAIVRHVALNHGGSVEVESTLGVGSVFRISIPAGGE